MLAKTAASRGDSYASRWPRPPRRYAAPLQRLSVTAADAETLRARQFSVALVLHTTGSDWARQHFAGIVAQLGECGSLLVEVVDCAFSSEAQASAHSAAF